MFLNISIDNLTIDEGIPGLKIGKLSATDASGAVTGTFSISNLPKYNGKDVPILEIKGNDLYLSEAWVANFENNYFESFAIGQVWAYPLSPKITFQDNTSVQTTEKVFTIQFNDLDESIELLPNKIFTGLLGAEVATLGGVDTKFNEFILGWDNKHDFFNIAGNKLKLRDNYYFDGEKLVNILNNQTYQIDTIPDLKLNVKGGKSYYYNGFGDPTYGDTIFKAIKLKTDFLNSTNKKDFDETIIKLVPQVFSTNEFGATIATITILDKNITPEQILFNKTSNYFEIAKTTHNYDGNVKDLYSYELRLKEKYFFDGVQIKDFQGNKINLNQSQDLFNSTEFIEQFFSENNFVNSQEIKAFNHIPSIVSNINNFSVNAKKFEYQFEAFDVDNQSIRFPTDPSKLVISGNSIASSQAVLEKVGKIALEKGTPAFASLIGDKDGVIEFGMTGIRSIDTDIPIFLADRFLLASNSKSMTGFLVAKFVDDDKLTWETKIPSLFPNISNIHDGFKNISMKDLMDHTSGVPYTTAHEVDWTITDIVKQRADFAKKIFTSAPEVSNYTYFYSNINQVLAAAALENISGKSWETLMQEYIFSPLGMNDSGFGEATIAGINQPSRHDLNESSQIYQTMKTNNPGEDIHWWKVPNGITKFTNGDLKAVAGDPNPALYAPATSITMSIWDWAKYAAATLNKGNFGNLTMKPDSWKSFITPDSDGGNNGTYSGGWGTWTPSGEQTPTWLSHRGAVMGWRSDIEVDLDKGYFVIGFSNEAYFQGHPELSAYLKENFNKKVKSEYIFDFNEAIKNDSTTYSMEQGPEWLSFNSNTGLLEGTATSNNIGNHNIKLKATDSQGGIVEENISIEVTSNIEINLTDNYETYKGTTKNDKIWGSNSNDILIGNEGDDTILGGQGNDEIEGGSGNDEIEGGSGNDIISSGLGRDYLKGNSGDDIFQLTADSVWSSSSEAWNISSENTIFQKTSIAGKNKFEDVFNGSLGQDVIQLTSGSDAFFLHDAISKFNDAINLTTDTYNKENTARLILVEAINGGEGDDLIDLTSPDIQLSYSININGENGNDIIWSSAGTDTLNGGDGNDVLFGGKGIDNLTGGNGADTFEFCNQSGNDIIKDYNKADGDKLAFYLQSGDSQSVSFSGDTITWGSLSIQLEGITLSSPNDFLVEYNLVA